MKARQIGGFFNKRFFMIKIYLTIALGVLVMGAYFYGANIEHAKCKTKYLQNDFETITKIQQKQKVIHDKVYKTGVADIRRILFNKYTISE